MVLDSASHLASADAPESASVCAPSFALPAASTLSPTTHRGGILRYTLLLPAATPSNNIIKGMHFRAYQKTRQGWRLMVLSALKGVRPAAPIQRARLVIIRHSAGFLDWDNALGGLKPLLDCLVSASKRNPDGLGLIADDNPTAMPEPPYMRQKKCKRGQGHTECCVYEL